MLGELDLETVAVIQLVTKARDRGGEPQLLELRRMELMRQLVHRRRQLSDVTQQFLYPGPELAHGLRGLLAQEIQRHGQERQPLAEVVVQLARYPPRLTFLRLEQAPGQAAKLDLAQPQLPHRLPAVRHFNAQADAERRLENEKVDAAADVPPAEIPATRTPAAPLAARPPA